MDAAKTLQAIHDVLIEADSLIMDGGEFDALAASLNRLGDLIPETERPASPSYAVRLLMKDLLAAGMEH